jgi:hypothetical protein
MTEKELQRIKVLESITAEGGHHVSWAPLMWAQNSVRKAWEEKLISSDMLYHELHK